MNDILAHNIETDANVGATFHLEPNHQPRAGETARVWFALTRKGGEPIPLEDCNCQLTVYDRAATPPKAILQPSLSAIDVERYRSIPSASFAFPTVGLYELELKGAPKTAGEFQAFRLRYPVTVIPGLRAEVAPNRSIAAKTQTPVSEGGNSGFAGIGGAVAIALFLGLAIAWGVKRRA